MPVGLGIWGMTSFCGPSAGPFFGSILSIKGGWRWNFWFLAIISGVSFLAIFFLLPESYGKTILYRRALILKKITKNENITSQGEIEFAHLTRTELFQEILWRPIQITFSEPVVLLIDIYIALVYAVMYLWFEAYPIVFVDLRGWGIIQLGVSYLSIIVGVILGAGIYFSLVHRSFTLPLLRNEVVYPEVFLPSAILGSVLLPLGIFLFGWASTQKVHWIVSLMGATIFGASGFLNFQSLFNYMGMSFPRYVASVFAGNDLFRSLLAGLLPLFGREMYRNLGSKKFPVGWGSNILGFIASLMILIPAFFYMNGPKLRARSKYAA